MTVNWNKVMIVPRDVPVPIPNGFRSLGATLHLHGLKQGHPPRTINAASWCPDVATKVQSCMLVSGVRLSASTANGKTPLDFFYLKPRTPLQLDLEGGLAFNFTLVQRRPGEVWVWPLARMEGKLAAVDK